MTTSKLQKLIKEIWKDAPESTKPGLPHLAVIKEAQGMIRKRQEKVQQILQLGSRLPVSENLDLLAEKLSDGKIRSPKSLFKKMKKAYRADHRESKELEVEMEEEDDSGDS